MELKDKLCLYKEILLGQSGNSLTERFRLIKIVSDNNVEDLYAGVRIDNLIENDFINKDIIRCDWADSLIFDPDRGVETVFLQKDDGYYYDVLDASACCILIDNTVTNAEYGCCNLRSMSYECVAGKVRVKSKKKDGRN